jgi:hypothetical protein
MTGKEMAMAKKPLNEAEALKLFLAWVRKQEEDEWGDKLGDRITPRYGYSGRGMVGEKCFGLEGRASEILDSLLAFAARRPRVSAIVRRLIQIKRQDSMGMEQIVYFPGVDLPKEE